jgi:uncharacterized protein (TIGR04255 family)
MNPTKITPDRIKDSIIELKVSFSQEFVLILAHLIKYSSATKYYKYTLSSNQQGNNYLFYNDTIKFQITEQTIAMNCNKKYNSWIFYFKEVSKLLDVINEIDDKLLFQKVGVRYVSSYLETDLRSILNFNFSFNFPNISSDKFSFGNEFEYKSSKVFMSLKNKISEISYENKPVLTSYIDIDIINDKLDLDIFEVRKQIDTQHDIEKDIFFGILDEDYLKSLNPVY